MRNTPNAIHMILLAGALTGCMSPTPRLDARFGEASKMLRAQQTLNPEASRNTSPVEGIDGKAARGALENYQDSFRQPSSDSGGTTNLNIGSTAAR